LNIYGDYILNFRFSDATYIRCISKEKFQQFVKVDEIYPKKELYVYNRVFDNLF